MDVSDLKRRVSRHFFDLVDEDANPLVVALALQDNSSVGLQHYADEFKELHEELRQALRSRVEESYQGFNESVGVYRQVVSSLKSGHEAIQGSKGELEKVHSLFSVRKPVIRDLHEKSVRFKRKLEILADLETLGELPSKFEASVASKDFGEARAQLSHAFEIVNTRNLVGQPTIKAKLDYVHTQRVQLIAKLVDEMHATIYLESPYSLKRLDPDNKDFAEFMKGLPSLPEFSRTSPEEDSFAYLSMLMQTLADLQSLGNCLDSLLQSTHLHLHQICVKTSLEVINDLKLTPESIQRSTQGETLLDQFRFIEKGALTTLATSLFLKLTKIMEAQRAVMEIAAQFGIVYDMDRVCSIIISTVKSFLLSYIGGEPGTTPGMNFNGGGGHTYGRPPLNRQSTNDNASRASRSRYGGPVFEFGTGDEDSRGLRDFETLRESLKKSIPGLLADDPSHLFAETKEQQKLEVVAPPHILNIWPLLEPSAQFFDNAHKIAPSEESRKAFDNFLDVFLQRSFIPRLQESFNEAIDDIAEDSRALDEMRNYKSVSQLPIVNCAAKFMETLALLSQLLDTGTSYREDYSKILIGLLSRIVGFFTTQLENLFTSPTAGNTGLRGGRVVNTASSSSGNSRNVFKVWDFVTKNPQLLTNMRKHFESPKDASALEGEFKIYFSKRKTPNTPKSLVSIADLLDIRMFRQAVLLITSVRWVVVRLRKMRRVATVETSNGGNDTFSTRVRKRWFLLDSSTFAKVGGGPSSSLASAAGSSSSNSSRIEYSTIVNASAMLGGKCLTDFDEAVHRLDEFTFEALCSLRADCFLRIVYYFDQMITNRDFHSSNRGEERDPVVDLLQQEMTLASQVFEGNIITSDFQFILGGIAYFMNELFILEGENISDMNEAGQNQILTNIFALQQMLTSFVTDPRDVNFSRATGFYELFRLNPTLIIDKARDGETDLGYEDLKLLLQIRHRNASGTSTSHAFGTLSAHISQLKEIFNAETSGSQNQKAVASNTNSSAASKNTATTPLATAPLRTPVGTSNNSSTAGTIAPQATRIPSVEPLRTKSSRSQSPEKQAPPTTQGDTQGAKPGTTTSTHPGPQLPPRSPNQDANRLGRSQVVESDADLRAQRARVEWEKQLAEQRRQREHEAKMAAEAEKLRREREALKSRSQDSLNLGIQGQQQQNTSPSRATQSGVQPGAQPGARTRNAEAYSAANTATSQKYGEHSAPLTAAAPSANAARSPLLNHRPRFESSQLSNQAQSMQTRRPSAPTVSGSNNSDMPPRRGSQPSSQSSSQQPITNTARPRTPSERALDAAQKVKERQIPQPSPPRRRS